MMLPATEANYFYTALEAAAIDRSVIEGNVARGYELMQRAGEAAWRWVLQRMPNGPVVVIAGAGNNAGDGYELARLLVQSGQAVLVVSLVPGEKLKNEAAQAYSHAIEAGVNCLPSEQIGKALSQAALVVDAIFGIGLSKPIVGFFAQVIEQVNSLGVPVLALDVPSGLCATKGAVQGIAIVAQYTLSFIVPKIGLVTGQGPDFSGQIFWDDLGLSEEQIRQVAQGYVHHRLQRMAGLPARKPTEHKGRFGHVLVVGGNLGMGGAAVLAAEAALSVGAGRVSLLTQPIHVAAALARCPEVMVHGLSDLDQITQLMAGVDAVVLGPGLGTDTWAQSVAQQVIQSFIEQPSLRLVLDADGLNLLAAGRLKLDKTCGVRAILTPHPGEALRLLSQNKADVWQDVAALQSDRMRAIKALVAIYGTSVVLKGAGSLIAHPGSDSTSTNTRVGVCTLGNPGMAVAGMGDVLSGVLGGLIAHRGISFEQACDLAVVVHAAAGDQVWQSEDAVSVRPSHLIRQLSGVLKKVSCTELAH